MELYLFYITVPQGYRLRLPSPGKVFPCKYLQRQNLDSLFDLSFPSLAFLPRPLFAFLVTLNFILPQHLGEKLFKCKLFEVGDAFLCLEFPKMTAQAINHKGFRDLMIDCSA